METIELGGSEPVLYGTAQEEEEAQPAQAPRKGPVLRRCGECAGCRQRDCDECINCRDRPSNGGPGLRKKACERRRCLHPVPSDKSADAAPTGPNARRSQGHDTWMPTPWPGAPLCGATAMASSAVTPELTPEVTRTHALTRLPALSGVPGAASSGGGAGVDESRGHVNV